jgi:hypothetical protein
MEYGRHDLTQATLLQSLLQIRNKSDSIGDQITTVRLVINLVHSIDDDCGLNGMVTQQLIADRIHKRFIPILWRRRPATLFTALMLIEDTLLNELEGVIITDAFSSNRLSHRTPNSAVVHSNSSTKSIKLKPSAMDTSSPSPKKASKGPMPTVESVPRLNRLEIGRGF